MKTIISFKPKKDSTNLLLQTLEPFILETEWSLNPNELISITVGKLSSEKVIKLINSLIECDLLVEHFIASIDVEQ